MIYIYIHNIYIYIFNYSNLEGNNIFEKIPESYNDLENLKYL